MIDQRAIKKFLNRELAEYDFVKALTESELDGSLANLTPAPDFGQVKMRLHQKACFLLLNELRRFLLFADMGAGKTVISLMLMKYAKQCGMPMRALVMVPYVTSVGTWINQVSEHAPDLQCVPLIGTTKENWEAIQGPGDLFVVCYQSAVALMKEEVPNPLKPRKTKWVLSKQKLRTGLADFNALFMDEVHKCFPAGTMISTPTGKVPIENIKIGDAICGPVKNLTVSRLFENTTNELCIIHLSDGRVIKSTRDHPFLTDEGWVRGEHLNGKFIFDEQMCLVWQRLHPWEISEEEKILRDEMLCLLANEPTRNTGFSLLKAKYRKKAAGLKEILCFRQEPNSSKIYENKNDEEKSNFHEGGTRKNIHHPQTTGNTPQIKGRKWSRLDKASVGSFIRTRERMASRISNWVRKKATRISHKLQSRFSKSGLNDCDRTRWEQIHTGYKEKHKIGRIRVVGVSIEKQRCPTPVFNLEVSESPHYFAGGILVHNCKDQKSLTFGLCRYLSERADWAIGLTGTPFGKDLQDLWPQFYLVDFGRTLGYTLSFYRAVFFNTKRNHWGGYEYSFKKPMTGTLKQMIKNSSIRYELHEFADMPPLIPITEYVAAPPEGAGYCKASFRQLANSKGLTGKEKYEVVESNYLKLRQLSSGFMTLKAEDSERVQIKFDQVPKLEKLCELIEGLGGQKVVVFHHFIYSNKLISDRLKKMGIKHARIWGGQSDKLGELSRFEKDPDCQVLVINSKSGSSSLNLQFASYMIFYESPDSPIDRQQAVARIYRPGQANKVVIYDLVSRGTLDEGIIKSCQDGKRLLDELLGVKK